MKKRISFLREDEFIGYLGSLSEEGIFRIATQSRHAKIYSDKESLESDLARLKKAFPQNKFSVEDVSIV